MAENCRRVSFSLKKSRLIILTTSITPTEKRGKTTKAGTVVRERRRKREIS